MRNLLNVLVVLFVLTTVRAFGQETFAPLIGDNTVVFVHLDLRKVELDTIKSQVGKFGEELLKQLHFDEKSFKATTRELNAELEKLDAFVRPTYETITKELGIQELAIIGDFDWWESCVMLGNGTAFVLAAPWKNKTENDLKTLRSLFQGTGFDVQFIPSGDFLFLPFPIDAKRDEVAALAFITWLQTIVPSKDSRIQQGLQVLGQNDEIKIVAALPEKLKAKIAALPAANSVPQELQGLLAFAEQKIEWAAASFSINALFSGEKTNDVLLTVKTAKRTDAVQLRGLLENAIEFGINAARFGLEQAKARGDDDFSVPPLFFEFAKGVLRTLLPDVEDDKLVFRLKGEGTAAKQVAVVTGGAGVAVGFLLPAIQAHQTAREQSECKTKLRNIVIAIHNYHNVNNGFPPLYTVDENGKPLHSWRVLLLPFMEQLALYQKIRLNEPWDSEYNKQFHNTVIDAYRCEVNPLAKEQSGLCCYSVIAGEGFIPATKAGEAGMQAGGSLLRITDGTSNTLAVVEVKQPFCWMDPTADITLDELLKGINTKEGRVGSFHPNNGINAALFDGSVRFLSNSISKEVLKALGTRAGGEPVRE